MIVCEKLHPLSILRLLLLVCADLFAIFYFHSYFTLVLLICLILIPAVYCRRRYKRTERCRPAIERGS